MEYLLQDILRLPLADRLVLIERLISGFDGSENPCNSKVLNKVALPGKGMGAPMEGNPEVRLYKRVNKI